MAMFGVENRLHHVLIYVVPNMVQETVFTNGSDPDPEVSKREIDEQIKSKKQTSKKKKLLTGPTKELPIWSRIILVA